MAIPPELTEGRVTDVMVVVDDDASYLSQSAVYETRYHGVSLAKLVKVDG